MHSPDINDEGGTHGIRVDGKDAVPPPTDQSSDELTLKGEFDNEKSPTQAMEEGVGELDRTKHIIITMPLSDPEHPTNWSKNKKLLVIAGGIATVIHSTLGSSLPSNASEKIAASFGVTDRIQFVLPISTFLMGYIIAPTMCGSLSENFGRKPVMLYSFLLFTIFTMACAIAPNWASFLFFRFLTGLMASAPIACVGGLFADINSDPMVRGRTMACFMAATAMGPVLAPPLSGFISQNTTWRWVFGVATLFAAINIPFVIFLPETYAPVLLSQRAAKMRKETGNENIVAQSDLEKHSFKYVLSVVMARPFKMLFRELIVSTTCIYLALCYGVFYLYFEAYPIIFMGPDSVYKFSPGISGLMFLPIAIGAMLALPVFFAWDTYLARAQSQKKAWAEKEEMRRLPLGIIGGPLYGISMLWLGWSAKPGMYWLAPAASGIPFGMGFVLIFMSLLNYLSDAYLTFAASAQGVASMARSLLGVLLPFAAGKMFQTLGIAWACSTLGLLALALGMVPFLFIAFGEKIRANSKFCQELKAMHEKEIEEKRQHDEAQAQHDV